jgi:hypothetical protein
VTKNQAVNILREIKKVAANASLTGALAGGGRMLANSYNSICKIAFDEGWIDEGIDKEILPVLEVNGDVNMDIVGCASALLLGLLYEE